jgi:sugar phosphate isomerase/epimerase
MSLQLAVATEDFGTPLRQAIPRAGQAKVPGVRLNARHEILAQNMSGSGLRQLGQYVRENRMDVAGLICPTRHSLADPDFLEERISLIRSAMDLTRPLHTKNLLVPCGLIPDPSADPPATEPGDSDPHQLANPFSYTADTGNSSRTMSRADQFNNLCQVTNDLAGYGNHVGCILTLQLPNYDVPLIKKLLAEVTTGPVQIVFDSAVCVFTGANVVDTYRNLYENVGYVRARDGRRNSDYSGTETAWGDGIVPWDEFLPTLIEADFTGWVCIERTGGDHKASDVLHGVSSAQSLLPQPADGQG